MDSGTTSSCHRVMQDKIDPAHFENFHNTPEKILARQQMQQGQWPGRGCEYCQKIEQTGGVSDRLLQLEREHVPSKVPPELYSNPAAVEVTPTTLEVYFNNTCNLACTYCAATLSSKWNDEIRRHGEHDFGTWKMVGHNPTVPHYDQMISNLWQYLDTDNRYKIIKHYHILGGEPLLQKELDQSIDFWQNHPNPDLTFNMITNLMLPHEKFVKKIQRFEQLVKDRCIYQLQITASLDCWGEQQEYARFGLNLDTWVKNFEYLLDKDWVFLSINSCISSLTIKTLPEFVEKINHWNQQRPQNKPIHWSFGLPIGLMNRLNGLNPKVFGPGTFDQDFEKVLKAMPETTEQEQQYKQHMAGIAESIKATPGDADKVQALRDYVTELDRRRGTDWKTLFPWLAI